MSYGAFEIACNVYASNLECAITHTKNEWESHKKP
jgi:hypothetical protein